MNSRPRILLTHTPDMRRNYYGGKALDQLRALGDVMLHEGAEPLGVPALAAAARGCALVVSDRNTPLPAEVFPQLADTAAVLRVAVDIRNIDVAAASRAGILVTHASRSWVPAVSELILALLLDIARGVSRADAAYKSGRAPDVRMGRQLHGNTAGVIGYGHLGRRMTELLHAMGMTVLVYDPYVTVERSDVQQVPLDELLALSDFVLPLAVATEETENLIGTGQLRRMKPSAILVNLSRGNLVDEAALEAALDSGRLAGCAMDVGRASDQMPTPRLAARPDVIATPHTAGLTMPAIEHQSLETVAQAAEIVKGRVPKGAVNAEHWKRKP
jgi:D-3-phosphoglycerate dehydrogenase / 2-oxoglutarate reductase